MAIGNEPDLDTELLFSLISSLPDVEPSEMARKVVGLLEARRAIRNQENDPGQHFVANFRLWAALTRWLLRPGLAALDPPAGAHGSERSRLRSLLQSQCDAIPDPHRQRGPTPLLLPVDLAAALLNGLEALDAGETPPIFKASRSRGHGARWTLAQAKRRAVEWTYFLEDDSKELNLTATRETVKTATGIAIDTLRKYDAELPDDVKADAREAGRLHRKLFADPDFGTREGESIDGYLLAFVEAMIDEPLEAFGAYYRTINTRHWGSGQQP